MAVCRISDSLRSPFVLKFLSKHSSHSLLSLDLLSMQLGLQATGIRVTGFPQCQEWVALDQTSVASAFQEAELKVCPPHPAFFVFRHFLKR